MFDILITISKKDFNKLRFVVHSIKKNINGFSQIYVISNEPIPVYLMVEDVLYFTDGKVTDFDYSRFTGVIKQREGWYRQQFIKLFQEVTFDNYLVIDSDVYLNRTIDVNPDNPPFLFGKDQYHEPYFRFMKKVFNLDKCYPHSFINEIMFFKRGMTKYILSTIGVDKYKFFDICVEELNAMNDASGFSEYELYGNFVTKHWPELYQYRYLKTRAFAKHRMWEDEEMMNLINMSRKSNYDIITMHSWM